jgi:hypothetical protein
MAALLCPPTGPARASTRGTLLLESLARARRSFTAQPRARRELIYIGLTLIVGLLVVPVLAWVVGSRILGPYSRGTEVHDNPLALLSDYFSGLAHGYAVFWVVALGPTAFVLLIRLLVALARRPAKAAAPVSR